MIGVAERLLPDSHSASLIAVVCFSRYLSSGHQYNAYLDLVFPDSAVNHEAGMQSVEMLVLHDRILLASSLQSFTPHYTSPLVRWMWSWTWALPLVTGLMHEQQRLTLHMFDALTEQEAYPATAIKVMLKSPHAHRFQIYSSTLRLQVQLFGLRYLMYHWQLTTGLLVTGLIFGFQLFWSAVMLAVLCLWCCGGSAKTQQQEEEEEAEAAAAAAALARAQEEEAAAAAAAAVAAASIAFEGKPQPPLFQGQSYRTGSIPSSFEGSGHSGGYGGGGYASYTKHRSSSSGGSHSSGGSGFSQRLTPPRALPSSFAPTAPPVVVSGPATPSLLAAAVKLEDDAGMSSEGEGESASASASEADQPHSDSVAVKHEQPAPAVPASFAGDQQPTAPSSSSAAHASVLRHRPPKKKHHPQKHPHPHPPHPAHARAAAATHAAADPSAVHASDAQPGHAATATP